MIVNFCQYIIYYRASRDAETFFAVSRSLAQISNADMRPDINIFHTLSTFAIQEFTFCTFHRLLTIGNNPLIKFNQLLFKRGGRINKCKPQYSDWEIFVSLKLRFSDWSHWFENFKCQKDILETCLTVFRLLWHALLKPWVMWVSSYWRVPWHSSCMQRANVFMQN